MLWLKKRDNEKYRKSVSKDTETLAIIGTCTAKAKRGKYAT
jgi:hypothetical protein